jgi:hypothetical protein
VTTALIAGILAFIAVQLVRIGCELHAIVEKLEEKL